MRTIVTVTVLYLFVMILFRVLGKRELAEMSPLELFVLLLIPEIASQALVGRDYSLTNAMVGISVLLLLSFVVGVLAYRFDSIERLVEGESVLLVWQGKVNPETMNRERISPDELMSEIRKAGLSRIEDVELAVLETNGKITTVPQITA